MELAVFLDLRDIGLKQCDHLAIIFLYISTFPTYIVAPGISFTNYLWPTFRVLWCDGQNQTILATVDLQLLYVSWEHWVEWGSKTTLCKVCIDLLSARQLLLHCALSSAFAWVVPNDGYHNKAQWLFCLHAKEEAIATKDKEPVRPNPWGCPFIKSAIFLSLRAGVCK